MSVATMSLPSSFQQHWNDVCQQQAVIIAAARARGEQRLAQAAAAAAAPPQLIHEPGTATALFAHTPAPRKAPSVVRATVLAATDVSAAVQAASSAAPLAAHVLADVADAELAKRLQSRLATLGIAISAVKAEVRSNEVTSSAATATAAPSIRTCTLVLTGRLTVPVGSLFNIMVDNFIRQHTQITQVERHITFIPTATASVRQGQLARSTTGSTPLLPLTPPSDDDTPCLDSPPLLDLKIKHLVKLLSLSTHTVVYTGDQLCQTVVAAASTGVTAASEPSNPLADLAAPHPPHVLASWVRSGRISHIINENADGLFIGARSASRSAAAAASASSSSSMSDEDDGTSSHSDESGSDAEAPLSHRRRMLSASHLTEVYGNRFVEVCTNAECTRDRSGNATSFVRDFEVAQMKMPAAMRNISGIANPTHSSDPHLTGRACSECGAPLRDTLVGWNEPLPGALMRRCVATASQADLSLVLGSQMRVSPVADLPGLATSLVIVQASTTGRDIHCLEQGGVLIRATPATVIARLQEEMGKAAPASTRAVARPSRVLASRPVGTQLAVGLARKDLKRRVSGSTSGAGGFTAALLTQFTQRRGALLNHGGSSLLHKPSIGRAATAAAHLHSMALPLNLRTNSYMPLSAALPPFPRLDETEVANADTAPSLPHPTADATARSHSASQRFASSVLVDSLGPSSVTSKSATADDTVTSSLLAITPPPPMLPSAESALPLALATPNYHAYRSLSPPPEFATYATPLPAAPTEDMQLL